MDFVSTSEILTALKAKIVALQLTDMSAAFEKVAVYSKPNLAQALQDLLIFEDRVCLIIPDGDDYQNEDSGRILISKCTRRVVLLLADRDYGDRQAASTGDGDNPGVIELDRLVVNSLIGDNLGLARVRVKCDVSEPFTISAKERDQLSGREAWHLDLAVEAGVLKTVIQRT